MNRTLENLAPATTGAWDILLAVCADLCGVRADIRVAERLALFDFRGREAHRVIAFECRCVFLARCERGDACAKYGQVKRAVEKFAAREAHAPNVRKRR